MTWENLINAVVVILFIVLVAAARIAWYDTLASLWLRFRGRSGPAQDKSALELLEERYARGEIDDEEFVARRRRLLERR